jgi:hypothetical protein
MSKDLTLTTWVGGNVPPAKMAEKSHMICLKQESQYLCSGRFMLGVQIKPSLESILWRVAVGWNTTNNSVYHNSPCVLLTGHAKMLVVLSITIHFNMLCRILLKLSV